jgi:hypothetical protein
MIPHSFAQGNAPGSVPLPISTYFNLQKLKSIHLQSVRHIDDQFMDMLSSHCSNLESFYLRQSENTIHDVSLSLLFQRCKHIKVFNIGHMLHNITDASFFNLSEYCPLLEVVVLYNIKISNLTLIELGKLTVLKEVYFNEYDQITDYGLQSLVRGTNRSNINSCNYYQQQLQARNGEWYQTNRDNSYEIINNNNNDNDNITRSGLNVSTSFDHNTTTSRGPSALETIFLKMDGEQVSLSSLIVIADHCPRLNIIFVADNHELITTCALEHMIQVCPKLTHIEGCSHALNREQSMLLHKRFQIFNLCSMENHQYTDNNSVTSNSNNNQFGREHSMGRSLKFKL